MPRDVSGNFTLDPSNPVSPGTVIETGWANPTLVDIAAALTDSLSRSGSGGMLAPFRFADGSVGAPGLAFVNEPTSGLYRAALNDIRFSIGAVDAMRLTPTGVTITNALTAGAGAFTSVTTPLVKSAGAVDLVLGANGGTDWNIAAAGKHWLPGVDNTQNIGSVAKRVAALFSPIVDSGAGSLVLKGAGTAALTITGANGVFAGTLAVTGAFTPAQIAGIVGTTTNNNAQAGSVGEYISSSLAVGSQLALVSATAKTIVSINLTAGDWVVDGVAHFNYGAADAVTWLQASISTVTNTGGALDARVRRAFSTQTGAGQINNTQQAHSLVTPRVRFLINGPQTVFLVVQADFTGAYASHGLIQAWRVR